MSTPELDHIAPYDGTIKSIVEPESKGLASHEEGIRVAIITRTDIATPDEASIPESWLPIRPGNELQVGQEVRVIPVISYPTESGGANVKYSITPKPIS